MSTLVLIELKVASLFNPFEFCYFVICMFDYVVHDANFAWQSHSGHQHWSIPNQTCSIILYKIGSAVRMERVKTISRNQPFWLVCIISEQRESCPGGREEKTRRGGRIQGRPAEPSRSKGQPHEVCSNLVLTLRRVANLVEQLPFLWLTSSNRAIRFELLSDRFIVRVCGCHPMDVQTWS